MAAASPPRHAEGRMLTAANASPALVNAAATATAPAPAGMRAEPRFLQNESYVAMLTSAVRAGMQDIMSYLPTSVSKSMASTSATGAKARILFARFELANIRPRGAPERLQSTLCLCLGYEDGYQIWDVHDTNNIQELVSVRNGPVRCLKILDHPLASEEPDPHAETRPHFVAIAHEAASQQAPFVVKIISLKAHELVHTFRHRSELSVDSNPRVMVLASSDNITVYDLRTYSKLFNTGICHPNPHHPTAAMALGSRWIAFATGQPVPAQPLLKSARAQRDPPEPLGHKIMTVAKDVAKDLAAGIYKMGDLGLQAVQSYLHPDAQTGAAGTAATATAAAHHGDLAGAGIQVAVGTVMIKDVVNQAVVAHFQAHTIPITAMAFNPSGALLATASEAGQELHVYQILPHVGAEGNGGQPCVRHLYKLVRGFFTSAVIEHIAFNLSSRWMSVTSARGTTHLFPINPTGGPVSCASHTNKVLNRFVVPRDDGQVVTLSSYAKIRHTINFPEVEDAKSLPVTSHFYFGETDEEGAPAVNGASAWGPTQRLLSFSPTGHLGYHAVRPYAVHVQGVELDPLHVETEALIEWSLMRPAGAPQVREPLDVGTLAVPGNWKPRSASTAGAAGGSGSSRWLAHVQVNTHAPPDRPLWQGNQFVFKALASPDADVFSGEEVGVHDADAHDNKVAADLRQALEADEAYAQVDLQRGMPRERARSDDVAEEDNEFDDALLVSADVPAEDMPAGAQYAQQWGTIAASLPTGEDLSRAWSTVRSFAAAATSTAAAAAAAAATAASAASADAGTPPPSYLQMPEDEAGGEPQVHSAAHPHNLDGSPAQLKDADPFDDDEPVTMWSPDGDNELGTPHESTIIAGRHHR